jgi:hypothetical protein
MCIVQLSISFHRIEVYRKALYMMPDEFPLSHIHEINVYDPVDLFFFPALVCALRFSAIIEL